MSNAMGPEEERGWSFGGLIPVPEQRTIPAMVEEDSTAVAWQVCSLLIVNQSLYVGLKGVGRLDNDFGEVKEYDLERQEYRGTLHEFPLRLRPPLGHPMKMLAYKAGGSQRVAILENTGQVHVYDHGSKERVASFNAHRFELNDMAIDEHGFIYTAGEDEQYAFRLSSRRPKRPAQILRWHPVTLKPELYERRGLGQVTAVGVGDGRVYFGTRSHEPPHPQAGEGSAFVVESPFSFIGGGFSASKRPRRLARPGFAICRTTKGFRPDMMGTPRRIFLAGGQPFFISRYSVRTFDRAGWGGRRHQQPYPIEGACLVGQHHMAVGGAGEDSPGEVKIIRLADFKVAAILPEVSPVQSLAYDAAVGLISATEAGLRVWPLPPLKEPVTRAAEAEEPVGKKPAKDPGEELADL
jgi:hypothetical protein